MDAFDPRNLKPFHERNPDGSLRLELTPEAASLAERHIQQCELAGCPMTLKQLAHAAVDHFGPVGLSGGPAADELRESLRSFVERMSRRHFEKYRVLPFNPNDDDETWDHWIKSTMASHFLIRYVRDVLQNGDV